MKFSPIIKTSVLFSIVLTVLIGGFAFANLYRENLDNRIQFSLSNHTGQSVNQQDLSGQYLLVFFGFTHCPHICPVGMSRLTQITEKLDEAGFAQRVTPVFISVDPERDTVATINTYLDSFHDRFIGLTGNRNALQSAAQSFKTYFNAQAPNHDGNYDVTHSTVIYIVDPYSRLVGYVPYEAGLEQATAQIKALF